MLQYLFSDTTPPVLTCPTRTVTKYFNTTSYVVVAQYPVVEVTDAVGIASVTYEPANGTNVYMRQPTTVTVTASDTSGNKASCQFTYVAERE